MFLDGAFSHETERPLRATAMRLREIADGDLARAFQVSDENPLVGVEGRARLLRSLSRASEVRLAGFCDFRRQEIPATQILAAVLERMKLDDVWRHPKAGLVPFHKLSQWLTYSLIEPLSIWESGSRAWRPSRASRSTATAVSSSISESSSRSTPRSWRKSTFRARKSWSNGAP